MNSARPGVTSPEADFAPFVDPAIPPAVQHRDFVVAVIPQSPPEPRRELAASMVDRDHRRAVADPANRHRLGKLSRRRDLHGHRIIRVRDVGRPVDVHRSRNVTRQVLLARASVSRVLDARRHRLRCHESADVDDTHVRVAHVLGQPVGRDDQVRRHGLDLTWYRCHTSFVKIIDSPGRSPGAGCLTARAPDRPLKTGKK